MKNPTPLFRFYPDPCPSCGEKVRTVITADPTDSELLREVFGCTSCSWLQEVGTRHPGKGYTWVTSEDEVDALRARVAELEILLEQKVRCQCGDDEACAHVRRVAELEAAVRTLHALAEPHFGEGTIDVPAMPELNRK